MTLCSRTILIRRKVCACSSIQLSNVYPASLDWNPVTVEEALKEDRSNVYAYMAAKVAAEKEVFALRPLETAGERRKDDGVLKPDLLLGLRGTNCFVAVPEFRSIDGL